MKNLYFKHIKYHRPHHVFFGKVEISFSRWPWMPIGGHWSHGKTPPTTKYGWGRVPGMGRFGGGWQFKLGIQTSGSSTIIDLIWGSIIINKYRPSQGDTLLAWQWPWGGE